MPTSQKTDTAAPTPPQNLGEALLAFQADMPRVGKTRTATVPTKSGGSYSYRYADLGDLVEIVLPVLNRCGLTFTCEPRRCDGGAYELVGVLHFALTDEQREGSLPLNTRGTPQELGSAITYARRYLFTAMTGIVTDEDDDAQAATAGQNEAVAAQVEADRRQAALNMDRKAAFNRWAQSAISDGVHPDQANRAAFVASVEAAFALPFVEVTSEQLARFPE